MVIRANLSFSFDEDEELPALLRIPENDNNSQACLVSHDNGLP
jgi:hypothetical protein